MPLRLRAFLPRALLLAATVFFASKAQALLKFNDGHDQINVTFDVAIGFDSNIYTYNGGGGDVSIDTRIRVDYLRRAGLIGVNANVGWNVTQFSKNSGENYANPFLNVELTKDSGRTTGSLTLGATRQNRADPNANLRTDSWVYNAGLDLKYPVIERYTISASLGYSLHDYSDDQIFTDLDTYSFSTDLFYSWTSQRDIFGGYRLRISNTSADTVSTDNAFTLGVAGKILAKLNGSVRAGYQTRKTHWRSGAEPDETYDGLNASASTTWSVSKRFNITGTLGKDFSTTSTNVNVDGTSANLDAQYALNSKCALFAGVGGGYNRFLGPLGHGRRDTFFTWNCGGSYTFGDWLRASLTYAYFQNWSTLSTADFVRETVTLNLVSRW